MLEGLLKYPWPLYEAGELQLSWPWPAWLAACVALTLASWWLAGHRGAVGGPARVERLGMTLLRGALLGLALLLLLRPVLVVPVTATQRPGLLVLVDESRSMTIADAGGAERSAAVTAALEEGGDGLMDELRRRFDVHRYAFGTGLRHLPDGESPRFDAARSDLSGALSALAAGPARAAPAAVLLIGDGGDDGGALDEALLALRARGVPVHALGAGEDRVAPDAELLSLAIPRRVFAGDSVEAEIEVGASGLRGRAARVVLRVDDAERAVADVVLPGDDRRVRVPLRLETTTPGLMRVTAALPLLPGERLDANNELDALVEVVARAPPVLHHEGEPRFEVKFLRRAVSEDEALALVSLVRTAENKFYRLGVASDDELADGFPRDAAALNRFAVVVLGARAAAALDGAQLALLEAFVAERGGALVLLEGARHGASPGAVIERLSPLPAARSAEAPAAVRVQAAADAADHPLTRFLLAGRDTGGRLQGLPALTLGQRARSAKPGAVTLLLGRDGGVEPLVVLAAHRYGRGRVVALPVRDTWRWQMHAEVGPHDQSHEDFWRQMLRWLAREVPAPVEVRSGPAVAVPGAAVEVQVTAREADWRPWEAASVRVRVTTPLGDQFTLDAPRGTAPGSYAARFVPAHAGLWELRVEGRTGPDGEDAANHWLEVKADGREFRQPGLDEARLRRIAAVTGGSYRPIARLDGLPEALLPAVAAGDVVQRLPLWDVPLLLLALVLLAVAEWAWRRWRRLP